MVLGTLSLTTTQGVRGRRFAGKLVGLTPGNCTGPMRAERKATMLHYLASAGARQQ